MEAGRNLVSIADDGICVVSGIVDAVAKWLVVKMLREVGGGQNSHRKKNRTTSSE